MSEPAWRIAPYKQFMRRMAEGAPESSVRDVGPYEDEDQARKQFEADAHDADIQQYEDLTIKAGELLARALAEANVELTWFEEQEMRDLGTLDYSTVQVVIGWIWRAAGIQNPS
jgi:hypothetical protein